MIDRLRKEAVEFYLEATKDFDIHSELFGHLHFEEQPFHQQRL